MPFGLTDGFGAKNMIKLVTLFCLMIFVFQNCGKTEAPRENAHNATRENASAGEKTSNQNSDKMPENGANDKSFAVRNFAVIELKNGAILGGFQNGKFVDPETAAAKLKAGEKVTLYNLDAGKSNETAKIVRIRDNFEICPSYRAAETDKKTDSGIALSSGANYNAVPREPEKLDANGEVYKKVVADFLKTKGIDNPVVKIEQLYRVDLEGDGKDEVVIRATNYKNFGVGAKKGEYSFVLVRKIVGEDVKNILLTGDFSTKDTEFSAPNRHEISAIADLNGDGKMEIVIYGEYFEGSWSKAYEVIGETANEVLETDCGP